MDTAKELTKAIADQEKKAANDLHDVKVALEQSHSQSKASFEAVLAVLKLAFEEDIAKQDCCHSFIKEFNQWI